MKTKALRHGEIVFEAIEKLPAGLKKSESKEFLVGSHGHPHSYDKGTLYLKREDDFVFGYFVAKGTKLYHAEHGEGKFGNKECKLPNGIYRLRRAVEFINSEMKQVID